VLFQRRATATTAEPTTRFDRWSPDDVYMALETALAEVTHQVDAYRACDAQQKAAVLESVDTRLQIALMAAQSLRRRASLGQRI
jgi:multidrug resistance efflux pump